MSNSSACWLPDGRTNSPPGRFVPCDPSAPNSACCAVGESCMGNGLCISDNGLIYRGGCTDRTYKDTACPTHCVDSSGKNAGNQVNFEFMKPCGTNGGDQDSGKLVWVCGLNNNCSDSSLIFALEIGAVRQLNITGNITATSTPSSIANSTQCPTQTPASSNLDLITKDDCSASKTAIGAGIGVPLGVLLVMALLWAFWERRKRSRIQHTGEKSWGGNTIQYEAAPVEAPNNERTSELPTKSQQTRTELA
ncbi:hypothetical protein VTL71DRAFT_11377 [Oculimacula yallundae]|uniref:Uncharacterized protein n=1 Tax=Oculimacula yallundae TaxID=86028 RepID=A0ABR4CSI2_9HELO